MFKSPTIEKMLKEIIEQQVLRRKPSSVEQRAAMVESLGVVVDKFVAAYISNDGYMFRRLELHLSDLVWISGELVSKPFIMDAPMLTQPKAQ